jgi:hypothetical protein
LLKSSSGNNTFNFDSTSAPVCATAYTLIQASSISGFAASDFTANLSGAFSIVGSDVVFTTAPCSTQTGLLASPTSSVYGQSIAFTATVTSAIAATGTVAFTEGTTPLSGCAAVPVTGGQAQCPIASLAVGSHSIVATYSPSDATTTGSVSTSANVSVGKAATSVAITPPGPVTLGNPVTVSVAVTATAPGAGTPSGTVTVSDGGTGAGDSCSFTLPATGCALTPGKAGSFNLSATYTPDTTAGVNFTGNSSTPGTALSVGAAKTGSTFTSSANPSA